MTNYRVWIGAGVAVAIWLFSNSHFDSSAAIFTVCTAARCT
ncbi:hypothetical protein [Paraburkholderia sp.]|nr:hypothetical protein [Paraburkholderia sp.]